MRPDLKNRALNAKLALDTYSKHIGDDADATPESDLVNLVADLMHYTDMVGRDFTHIILLAGEAYRGETVAH
jgi:hypothetical protein